MHPHTNAPRPIVRENPGDEIYDGRGYVAAEGLFWDIPCGPMRVAAAQLQHRVQCWGYVLQVRVWVRV